MSTSPRKRLPVRPSIEHLKKQAKRLAKERELPLASAQHELAADYGHRNWADLVQEVDIASGKAQEFFKAAAEDSSDHLGRMLRHPHSERVRYEALRIAAEAGSTPCVDQLLYTGLNANHAFEPFGSAPLHLAASRGHQRLVERLLVVGADPMLKDKSGNDAASLARKSGHLEVAELLKQHSPFAFAAAAMKRGEIAALKTILKVHPEITQQTVKGRSLLHVLADYPGDMPNAGESARALVAAGIPVDLRCDPPGANSTPLYWAASSDTAVPLIEALLDLGADINARAGNDETPMSNALIYNLPNVAKALFKRGAQTGIVYAAAFLA